jgi:hypothetical protein
MPPSVPQPPQRAQHRQVLRLPRVTFTRRRRRLPVPDLDDQRRRWSTGRARRAGGGSGGRHRVLGSPEQDVSRKIRGVVRGLRQRRREGQGRRRRRRGARLVDVDAAERAGGVAAQPQVDALGVEAVPAPGQEPGRLAVGELGEAHGALQRLAAPVLRPVHRQRQRPEQRRVDAASSDNRGITSSDRAALVGARRHPHPHAVTPAAAAAAAADREVVVHDEREGEGEEEEDGSGEHDVAACRRGRGPRRDGRPAAARVDVVLRQRRHGPSRAPCWIAFGASSLWCHVAATDLWGSSLAFLERFW